MVNMRDEGTGGDAGGEPIARGEALQEREEMIDVESTCILRGGGDDISGEIAEGVDGLLADHRLLNSTQCLEGLQQDEGVGGPADFIDKVAQLLGEGEEDVILIVDGVGNKGEKLAAGALGAQGLCNRFDAAGGIETELEVVILELIEEDGDGVKGSVELFVLGNGGGHGGNESPVKRSRGVEHGDGEDCRPLKRVIVGYVGGLNLDRQADSATKEKSKGRWKQTKTSEKSSWRVQVNRSQGGMSGGKGA